MSGAPSCTKCGNLLAVTSVSGLCPACAPAEPPTASFPAPAGEPNTITLPVAADPPPAADTPNIAADPTPASAAAPAPHAAPDAAATASAPSAPPARPERGQPADPPGYEIVHKIGRGGMGDVYLARETVSRQIVALKFLRDPDAPELLTRFELEFRALREVVHPNVVRVLGHDFQRGEPYFVMEYLEGGSLAEQLKGGPLDPTCAVDLIRKVAGAVQAMHEKAGILHRDIKPGNILLTNEGEPKLADFGLAKFLDAKTVHTLSGGMLGTLRYMPPEQINGKNGALGYPADVYGLGATLYHLLTGHPPFVRDGFDELLFAVLHDAPTDPRTIRSELTRGLSGVVMRCLEKDPRHRYQTVAEFLAALDRWAESETPPPVPPLERLRRWVRRNRVALAACALLALGGAAVATRGLVPHDPLASAQRNLERGRTVELVGEREPRWFRWVVGNPEFERVPPTGGGVAFNTTGTAMLELLPNPCTDRYRLSVELAQFAFADAKTGFVGLYFCAQKHDVGEGARLLYTQAVWFTDQPNKPQRLNFGQFGIAMVPLKWDVPYKASQTSGEHLPGPNGPWRRVEAEIDPDGITVSFQGQVRRYSREDLARHYDRATPDLGQMLGRKPPELVLPASSGSLGVIALGCRAGVRRFTITPLPLAE